MRSRAIPLLIGLGQLALVAGFGVGLARRWFPLGVPGEWEWLRLPPGVAVIPLPFLLGAGAVVAFAGFAALGARALASSPTRGREASWVAGLAVAAVVVQGVAQEGAPYGYGLARWVLALGNPGSSGYATVARQGMPNGLANFLRDYPAWVERQDSLHIGTHPPGLFIVARGLLTFCRDRPGLVAIVADHAPGSAANALRAAREAGLADRAEGAALALTGALTLLGSALTVVPLYLLARSTSSSAMAWAAASLWPLVPAALMFQPAADTAFPLLSISALALAAWSVVPGVGPAWGIAGALGAGLILALGMEFTLAFLAIGLVAGVVLMATPGPLGWRGRAGRVAATGAGFALGTGLAWALMGANPLAIWWTNQAHHAQFYREYPRSWGPWALANGLESAVAVGLPAAVWAGLALIRPRSVPTAAWATLGALGALTVTGRSLSEVARLWLPMYPVLLTVAAAGWRGAGLGPRSLAWACAFQGAQALTLLATIQVVYPV